MVPYEGRTCRGDRAGKTRTALLEAPTAKLMRVNDKSNLIATKFCSVSKMSHESDIPLRANFTIQTNCAMQNYFSPKANKEI